jgi:protein TonB
MWSLTASSILGVGHFPVPPDVVVEADVSAPLSTIRTIVVPHGIAAVPRRSPIKARKRTPWNPSSETHGVIERADHREWFTDRLIVESRQAHLPAACTTSAVLHVVIVMLVLLLLAAMATRADVTPHVQMNVSLRMPAFLSPLPIAPPSTRMAAERPDPRPAPPSALASETPTAVPLETPSSIEAEPAKLDDAASDSAAIAAAVGGTTDGVAGGVVGGTGNGSPVAAQTANGPFRVGDGIARPRKIKDVRPVYPPAAMASRSRGNVLIEATIGTDGKVHDARVLQSVAVFEQAALDAVRQWEFEPSRVNGEAVAVRMVIVVTFALL